MEPDLMLVAGIVVCVFSVPAMVSAISDGRTPRVAAIAVLVGGGLVVAALNASPGGYALADVPRAFARVIGGYLN